MLGKLKPDFQQNLFQTRLTDLINLNHPLVKLAKEISWDNLEFSLADLYSTQGRPFYCHKEDCRFIDFKRNV